MTETIFVKTDHFYWSYKDFWRLVELSGFPIVSMGDIDVTRNANYIISPFNGEWDVFLLRQQNPLKICKFILWQLERPLDKHGYVETGKKFDEIWTSDKWVYNEFKDKLPMKFVLMGSHLDLAPPVKFINKSFDFAHMSYINGRRMPIYGQLQDLGCKIAKNAWDEERDNILAQTKFGLTVHQDNLAMCEPLRIAMYAAYGLPVISESINNPEIYNGLIFFVPFNHIVDTMFKVSQQYSQRAYENGMLLRSYLCIEHTFERGVRDAINA